MAPNPASRASAAAPDARDAVSPSLDTASHSPHGGGGPGKVDRLMAWLPVTLFLAGFALLLVSVLWRGRVAEEAGLNHLLAETREAAGGLESLLERLDRELALFAGDPVPGPGAARAPEASEESGRGAVSALATHLHDLGPVLVGVAHLDSLGLLEEVSSATLAGDSVEAFMARIPGAVSEDPEARIQTGLLLGDGRAAAALPRPLAGGPGFLVVVFSLDNLKAHLLGSESRPPEETFFVMDEPGHLLVHPVREWIGYLLLTEADSLFDPELHRVLPQVLGPEAGAWDLVSETLTSRAWMYGRHSSLAVAPLALPGGGRWKVGLAQHLQRGFLLGLPATVQVRLGTFLLASLLMALGLLVQGGMVRGREMERVRGERDWFQAMMTAGADGVLVTRAGQGTVLDGNPGMARLAGLSREGLLGARWVDLLETPPDPGGPAKDPGIPPGRSEARLRTPGGEVVEVEVSAGEFSHGGEDYTVAVVRDQSWRRRLERETLRVGERERLLLGKELHDGLGQHLTGVAFMAKTLARKLVAEGARDGEKAEEIGQLIKDAVGQIRILSKGLELSEYDGQELPGALEEMSAVVGRLMGVSVELDLEPALTTGEWRLGRAEATQLYRICHDVVSDAVRSRMAQKVRIQLRNTGPEALLSLQHDGTLEDPERRDALSVLSYRLRYRARLLDAALEIRENPEGVTTILCSFKVSGDQA